MKTTPRARPLEKTCVRCLTIWHEPGDTCPNCGCHEWCKYIPTQADIRAGCARIQATWDKHEEHLRSAWSYTPAGVVYATTGARHNGKINTIAVEA